MQNRIAVVAGLAAIFVVGCGEGEQPDPRLQCDHQELKTFAVGSASTDDGTASFDLSTERDISGRITDNQIRVHLGDASPPGTDETQPVLLYLTDPTSDGEFYRNLDDWTHDAPLVVDVVDASSLPPGEEDRMSVSHLDCSIEQNGSICAQIGFDSANDEILGNDDEYVFNATGGTITIDGYDYGSQTFSMNWQFDIGPNVHSYQDQSTGDIEGCLRAGYDTDLTDYWALH